MSSSASLLCQFCSFLFTRVDIVLLQCGHYFHIECFEKWQKDRLFASFKSGKECPECYKSLHAVCEVLAFDFESGSSIYDIEQISELTSKNKALEQQLKASEENFLKLQEQYSKQNEELKELQKILELQQYESNKQQNNKENKNENKKTEDIKNITISDNKPLEASTILLSNLSIEPENEDYIQSVLIKNVKENFKDDESLRKYVLKLSDLMDLCFIDDDIERVRILQRRNQHEKALIAKFKTLELKCMFLSKKDKLKHQSETNHLFLYEYASDKTNNLFQHAKSLRNFGYKNIYCHNNAVFAKTNFDSIPNEIKDRNDIEKLKNEAKNQEQSQ